MDQYRQYNTDPARPMFTVLHHDGDNYGGGSDAYYHNNFQQMVNWANGNQNYNVTTIQDYLDRFPVPQNAVVHVEPGSWAGADNGDAEFKKWLGDPNGSGWSPDRNSWAVLTAAKNRVYTAEDIVGAANPANVIANTGTSAERAWHYLTQAMASDHWYWDGTEVWDSNVTRGSNLAVAQANNALTPTALANEATPPSVFLPQRDAYNPGNLEFGTTPESADFKVWTYAYDVSGLSNVTLKYRVDADGENPIASTQNEIYAGGSEVGNWISLPMTASDVNPPGNILSPTVRAQQYAAMINGQRNALLDYYVEAIDAKGNITRSEIQHVWVGGSSSNQNDFTMDGQLDAGATLAGTNAGLSLHYSRKGGKLYLATNAAGSGNDRFVYVARTPGAMQAANWAKFGQIARWDAFLGNEADNGWSGWFDAPAGATAQFSVGGGTLEGTLDLVSEFGFVPSEIYIASSSYQSADGGQLVAQMPASLDADKNIQANEYQKITLGFGWNGVTSNSWHTTSNWFDGALPNAVGAHAQLLSNIGTHTSITLAAPASVGRMTYDSPLSYTIAGAAVLSIDAAPAADGSISVAQGSHRIDVSAAILDNTAVNVANGASLRFGSNLSLPNATTLTKLGGGTLEITGAVTSSPGTQFVVQSGVLRAAADFNGASVIVNGGDVQFDASQHLSSLTIGSAGHGVLRAADGSRRIKTNALSVAGQFDIETNGLIVDYTAASPLSDIRSAIINGYNNGSWNGNGIMSVFAGAMPNRAIGYAEASAIGSPATFLGENIDGTSLLVRFTVTGDADLNGIVNISDFSLLAANFNTASVWSGGDFNYSGTTDIADFALLAANFNTALPVGLPRVAVPEPAAVAILAVLACTRRRRI